MFHLTWILYWSVKFITKSCQFQILNFWHVNVPHEVVLQVIMILSDIQLITTFLFYISFSNTSERGYLINRVRQVIQLPKSLD